MNELFQNVAENAMYVLSFLAIIAVLFLSGIVYFEKKYHKVHDGIKNPQNP